MRLIKSMLLHGVCSISIAVISMGQSQAAGSLLPEFACSSMRRVAQTIPHTPMFFQRSFSSSRLLSLYEPLVTPSVPLVAMKTDVRPFSSRSFSSISLGRYNAFPLTYNSHFSTPRRFFSDRVSEHNVRRIGNPCIDGVFQYGFESPIALKGFLNTVLGFEGGKSIQSVEYLKRDMPAADPTSSLGYHFTVDVRCRTIEGQHFLVEMQNDFRDDYHLKSLIEHSRMLSRLDIDQTIEDKDQRFENNIKDANRFWKSIQGIYTVVITNKGFPLSRMKSSYQTEPVMEPLLVNAYELRHVEYLDRHYGDVPNQIVLLMLDNLKKPVSGSSSLIERWAYLFKDSSMRSGVKKIQETKEIEDPEIIVGQDEAIREFIETVDIEHLPLEIRDRYLRAVLLIYEGSR